MNETMSALGPLPLDALLGINQALTLPTTQSNHQRNAARWVAHIKLLVTLVTHQQVDLNAPAAGQRVWQQLAEPWLTVRPDDHFPPEMVDREAQTQMAADPFFADLPLPTGMPAREWWMLWALQQGALLAPVHPGAPSALEWAMPHLSAVGFGHLVTQALVEQDHPMPPAFWALSSAFGQENPDACHTLLGMAVEHPDALEVLLAQGLPADEPDAQGRTPFNTAQSPLVLGALVRAGANPHQSGPEGRPAAWRHMNYQQATVARCVAEAWAQKHGPDAVLEQQALFLALGGRERMDDALKQALHRAVAHPDQHRWTDPSGQVWGLLGQSALPYAYGAPASQARAHADPVVLHALLQPSVPAAVWAHESVPGVPDVIWAWWAERQAHKNGQPWKKPMRQALLGALAHVCGDEAACRRALLASLGAERPLDRQVTQPRAEWILRPDPDQSDSNAWQDWPETDLAHLRQRVIEQALPEPGTRPSVIPLEPLLSFVANQPAEAQAPWVPVVWALTVAERQHARARQMPPETVRSWEELWQRLPALTEPLPERVQAQLSSDLWPAGHARWSAEQLAQHLHAEVAVTTRASRVRL